MDLIFELNKLPFEQSALNKSKEGENPQSN